MEFMIENVMARKGTVDEFGLTENHTCCTVLNCAVNSVRLVAGDQNAVFAAPALKGRGQSHNHIAGNGIDGVVQLIYNATLNYAQEIEQR